MCCWIMSLWNVLQEKLRICFEQATVVSLQHCGEVYSVIQYAGLLQSSLFMVSVSVH